MRLDGELTPFGTDDAHTFLPRFFASQYPKLVEFLDLYIDSLYKKNLTPDQVNYFLENEEWWENKDKVYESEDHRFIQKIIDFDKYRQNHFGILSKAVNLLDNKSLERNFELTLSLDNFQLVDSEGVELLTIDDEQLPLYQYLDEKNLGELANSQKGEVKIDLINLIKFTKHLFRIRGTAECAKIFLSAMYNAQVEVSYPRLNLATLEDNFTLDGKARLRDDFEYDEYTYVVNIIAGDYKSLGQKYFDMYKRVFHACGFRCLLEIYDSEEEWLMVSGDHLQQPEGIENWRRFFETKFIPTIQEIM